MAVPANREEPVISKLHRHLTYANVMATIAVFVALGGSSYAALKVTGKNVADSSLTGRDVRNASLTTSDIKNRSLRSIDFRLGDLPAGPSGPKGDPGGPGPKGEPGEPAAKLFAAVQDDGTLVAGSGATGASRVATGTYDVAFNRDLRNCIGVSNVGFGDVTFTGPSSYAVGDKSSTAVGWMGNHQSVRVNTVQGGTENTPRNNSFVLAVIC